MIDVLMSVVWVVGLGALMYILIDPAIYRRPRRKKGD